MNKQEQLDFLAAMIKQAEQQLFATTIEEAFWQVQALGSKNYDQMLGVTQTKKRVLENQIPYYKNKLTEIETDFYVYEPFKKKK